MAWLPFQKDEFFNAERDHFLFWLKHTKFQLNQGFSTWCTLAPGGTQKVQWGMQKVPGYTNYSIGLCNLRYWEYADQKNYRLEV